MNGSFKSVKRKVCHFLFLSLRMHFPVFHTLCYAERYHRSAIQNPEYTRPDSIYSYITTLMFYDIMKMFDNHSSGMMFLRQDHLIFQNVQQTHISNSVTDMQDALTIYKRIQAIYGACFSHSSLTLPYYHDWQCVYLSHVPWHSWPQDHLDLSVHFHDLKLCLMVNFQHRD